MTTTAGSLVATVGVIYLHHEYPRKPVPQWLRRIARVCLVPGNSPSSRLIQTWGPKPGTGQLSSSRGVRVEQAEAQAHLLGAGAGPNFVSTFERWDSVFQRTSVPASVGGQQDNAGTGTGYGGHSHTNHHDADILGSAMEDPNATLCLKDATLVVTMRELCKNIRKLREKYDEEEEIENFKEEWRIVVKLVDRVSLIVFAILLALLAVAILYVYPAITTGDPTWHI